MPETDLTLLRTLLISRDVLPCERKRYLALWHVQLGATTREIEQWKVMSADRVSRTVRLYREGGLDALLERVHPGGRSRISPQIASAIQAEIKKDQQVWDSASLMAYVQEAHGITIRRTALRVQLIRIPINLIHFSIRHPTFQHQADEFWAIYTHSTGAVERRRSQLLALLAEGRLYAEVLPITRYSYQGADKIVDAYLAHGLESITDQRHGNRGAPTLLSDAELLLLAQSIRADIAEGGVWSGNRVQDWVRTTLNKELYLSRCYEFLDAVGYSRQVPRPRHVEADQEGQEDFKKKFSLRLSRQLERVLKALDGGSKSGAWTSTESAYNPSSVVSGLSVARHLPSRYSTATSGCTCTPLRVPRRVKGSIG